MNKTTLIGLELALQWQSIYAKHTDCQYFAQANMWRDLLPQNLNDLLANVPINIFENVATVLKPGAPFVVSFSGRWFPPKVIKVWQDINAFERIGLIIEYFRRAQMFANIESMSVRNLPHPEDDKLFQQRVFSDPLFTVWGYVK